jgi:hypothetical protein
MWRWMFLHLICVFYSRCSLGVGNIVLHIWSLVPCCSAEEASKLLGSQTGPTIASVIRFRGVGLTCKLGWKSCSSLTFTAYIALIYLAAVFLHRNFLRG